MKAAFLSENNAAFDKLFKKYREALEEFLNLVQGQLPVSYYAFDTRILLSTGLSVNFDKNKIKSKAARSCYSRLMKLSDLWFTYETLLNIVNEQGFFADKSAKATALTDKSAAEIFELTETINSVNILLNNHCLADSGKYKKIQDYLTFLAQGTNPTQVAVLNKALAAVKSKKNLGIQELTGWIYAIRNAFVINGDTSVSRIKNMDLAKILFEILYDFLLLVSIKIAAKLIYNKIKELSN
jgi:hypothetical protein